MVLYAYRGDKVTIHHSIDRQPNEDDFPMHAHPLCELFYFISGNGYYTVEGNDYPLKKGCIMIMRDGETHKLHIASDTPYERISVHFPISLLGSFNSAASSLFLDRPFGKENYYLADDASRRFLRECMSRICRVKEGADGDEEEIISNLLPVIAELNHIKKNQNTEPAFESDAFENEQSSDLVANMISFINLHLTEIENLEIFEQEFFFSKSYLNRIFKESTGASVWDYVVLKRLLMARNLLREGKTAAIASAECGFCDYSSFYRQYKQRFGVSPLADKGEKK